jgi:hypothetical protein
MPKVRFYDTFLGGLRQCLHCHRSGARRLLGGGNGCHPGHRPVAVHPADEWTKMGALLGFWLVGVL